nr:hypothetical protein [Candidatus Sigynarchaeota archaeon]
MNEGQQKKVVSIIRIAGIICLITGVVMLAITIFTVTSGEVHARPPVTFALTPVFMMTGMGLIILSAVLSFNWGITTANLVKHARAFTPRGQYTPHQQPAERVIIREIVKVKCPYCGHLVENTESTCPNCHGDM